ncbi:MAG: response regulator transcription factor [Planctomycetota bacterium]
MNGTPTVFVVDDDPSVRRSLRRLIESVGLSVETFGTAQEFLDNYDRSSAGCLVLDVRMPGLGGLELQERLSSENLPIPIIFITGHGDVPMTARAMKAGAVDFIQKPFNEQDLLDAISRALDVDSRSRRIRAEQDRVVQLVDTLTPREREVMKLVVTGKLNKEIAAELGITEKTIKVHRARVMEKMQADSLAQLVLLAQVAGLCNSNVPSQ